MGRPLQVAMRIKPRIADTTIKANPSARPQTSSTFDNGMYIAAVIAFETMYMTFRRECESYALVTNGTRL